MSRYKDLTFQVQGEDKTAAMFRNLSNNVVGVASKFRSLRLSVANIQTIALSAIGGYFMKSLIDAGDEVNKLNQKLNISTEALSQYRYVAQMTGTTFETWTGAMQKLSIRVSEATRGEGEAVKVLKELGIEANAFSKLKPDEQFEVIADRLLDVKDNTDKVRIANKLFEEGGVSLLQSITNGSDGLRSMRQEAHDLGLTLSQSEAQTFSDFNDSLAKMNTSLKGLTQEIVIKSAPAIIWIFDTIKNSIITAFNIVQRTWNELYNSLDEVLSGFFELGGGMKTVAKGISYAFEVCSNLVQKSWLTMKMTAVSVFSGIITLVGETMELMSTGLNKIGVDNSFTQYLTEKGEVLSTVTDGLEEYLQEMIKVQSYEELDKKFDFTANKDSGIGQKINFQKTEYPESEFSSNTEASKEYNRLLQARNQILNEIQTPTDKFIEKIALIEELNQANLLTQVEYNEAFDNAMKMYKEADGVISFKDAIQSTADSAMNLGQIMESAIGSAIDGLASQITNFVLTGKANFLELAGSIAKMVLEMTIKLLILKTLMSAMGMSTIALKKGSVFSSGNNVTAFAEGGIVGTPTLFPMSAGRTGLMGEAGPEAIMPLTRGYDGKLGVKLYNKNSKQDTQPQNITNISFNVKSNSPEEFRRSQAQIEADLINTINRAKRNA